KLPRAEHGVRSIAVQPAHGLAGACARPSQPLLFPARRRAEPVPVSETEWLRRPLVREERRACARELRFQRHALPPAGRTASSAEPVADERSALLFVYLWTGGRSPRYAGLPGRAGSHQGAG